MKRLLFALSLVLLSSLPTTAQFNQCRSGFCSVQSNTGVCGQDAVFLARTTGLDATHTTAYSNLICGLVADGTWTKFDVLYILATQNSTTALLNLVSTSYNGTLTAGTAVTFTADRGFTGVDTTGQEIDTGFNPSTAPSPKFVQNSGHVSAWSVLDIGSSANGIIGITAASESDIYPKFTDNNAYFRLNSINIGGVANATPIGYYLSNRADSSTVTGDKNGSLVLTNSSATSAAVPNFTFYALGIRNGLSSGHQAAQASIGSGFTPTEKLSVYNRLRTYMTAVGVP